MKEISLHCSAVIVSFTGYSFVCLVRGQFHKGDTQLIVDHRLEILILLLNCGKTDNPLFDIL